MQNNGNQTKQFDLDDFNLNSNPNEISWETPVRDPRTVGDKTMNANQVTHANQQNSDINWGMNTVMNPSETPNAGGAPELGQIVNLEMPPVPQPESIAQSGPNNPQDPAPDNASSVSFDKTSLKTAKQLDKRGVATVNQAINQFNHQSNPVDFYNAIRGQGGMMETNLKQSYNRTLGDAQ